MTRDEFIARVQQLEEVARQDEAGYKRRVGLFALGGYAYFLGLLALALFGGLAILAFFAYALLHSKGRGAAVLLKLSLPLFIFLFAMLKALWVRFEAPDGLKLQRGQAPKLFDDVEQLRSKIGCPRIHDIVINDEFNAAMAQTPRLGPLGWTRNTLVLGLPYLIGSTREQVLATIAHELGHLSHEHGAFSARIYRMAAMWGRLNEQLEQSEASGKFLYNRFLSMYVPQFSAYTFVLRRMAEYQADRVAYQAIGLEPHLASLVNDPIVGRLIEQRFWKEIYQSANSSPTPPDSVYRKMDETIRRPLEEAEVKIWVRDAMRIQTGYSDTHPCLRDRLTFAANEAGKPELAASENSSLFEFKGIQTSALDFYFGQEKDRLFHFFDTIWRGSVTEPWAHRFKFAQEEQVKLRELKAKVHNATATEEETLQFCHLVEEYDETNSLSTFQAALAKYPENQVALFNVGRLLLEKGDETGIALVELVMETKPHSVPAGCDSIIGYLVKSGRRQDATPYLKKYDEYQELSDQAEKERSVVGPNDEFLPDSLTDRQRDLISRAAIDIPAIRAVHAAAKKVRTFPDIPFHVLAIDYKKPFFTRDANQFDTKLLSEFSNELDEIGERMYLLLVTGANKKAGRKIASIPGSRVFQR